jgi:acyl carrier protein
MSAPIPQGIEILVKKASLDAEFRELLLSERTEAARQIALELTPAEAMMLRAVPREQLEAIIAQVTVPQEHRRAFLGKAAAVMLAALGVGANRAVAQEGNDGPTRGIRPDAPPNMAPGGVRPDRPEPPPTDTPPEKKPDEKKKEPDQLEKDVIEIISKQFKATELKDITRETSLVKDLGAKPKTLASLRKALDKKFKIKLPGDKYKKLGSVGDLVDLVRETVDKKQNPNKPAPTHGIRPDRPAAAGGIRPDDLRRSDHAPGESQ